MNAQYTIPAAYNSGSIILAIAHTPASRRVRHPLLSSDGGGDDGGVEEEESRAGARKTAATRTTSQKLSSVSGIARQDYDEQHTPGLYKQNNQAVWSAYKHRYLDCSVGEAYLLRLTETAAQKQRSKQHSAL